MMSALRAAARGAGKVSPNPAVGAAVLLPDGTIRVSHHARFGGPHAEGGLLARYPDRLPRGSTLYLTLEPCFHQGKTPPCVEAVLRARPSRVVVATLDPDSRVRGRSIARLESAGIRVEIGMGRSEALELDPAFHVRHRWGRALVRLKLATSLDGRVATTGGQSRWITGDDARRDVHRDRARSDAVVIGAGTEQADDPMLTVREVRGPEPSKIVLDSALRTRARGKLWKAFHEARSEGAQLATTRTTLAGERVGNHVRRANAERWVREPRLIVATTRRANRDEIARRERIGWEVWVLPADALGGVSIRALLRRAAKEGLLRLLVEAGPTLASSLLRAGLIDELCLYYAPLVLGGDRGWSAGYEAIGLSSARRFERVREVRLGDDWKVELRRKNWDEGLAL